MCDDPWRAACWKGGYITSFLRASQHEDVAPVLLFVVRCHERLVLLLFCFGCWGGEDVRVELVPASHIASHPPPEKLASGSCVIFEGVFEKCVLFSFLVVFFFLFFLFFCHNQQHTYIRACSCRLSKFSFFVCFPIFQRESKGVLHKVGVSVIFRSSWPGWLLYAAVDCNFLIIFCFCAVFHGGSLFCSLMVCLCGTLCFLSDYFGAFFFIV